MKIEFYIPLPSDGFWAALNVYYLIGVVVSVYCISKWEFKQYGAIQWHDNGVVAALFFMMSALVWPVLLLSYYRNR